MMRSLAIRAAIAAGALLAMVCCQRIDIIDTTSNYKIETSYDESAILYKQAEAVNNLSLILFDTQIHNKSQSYLLAKEGGYLPESVMAGEYTLFLYQMDLGSTLLKRTDDIDYTHFTTSTAEDKDGVKIYGEPTHVFQYCAPLSLPTLAEDEEFVHKATMRSVCDSWRVIISGMTGAKYATKADMYIHNQCTMFLAGTNKPSGEGVLHHEMLGEMRSAAEDGTVTCDFCTFGMPEEDKTVNIQLNLYSGSEKFSKIFDVTSQVYNPSNTEHIIKIKYEIQFVESTTGGLEPSAQEWEEDTEVIDLS